MKGYPLNCQLAIFFLQKLSQQIQFGIIPLSDMETIFIQYLREFLPARFQLKLVLKSNNNWDYIVLIYNTI
jgi:hypothetical protein